MENREKERDRLLHQLIERLEPLLAEEIDYREAALGGGLLGKKQLLEQEKRRLLSRLKERMRSCSELLERAFRSIAERAPREEKGRMAREFSKVEELVQKPLEELEKEAETASSFRELLGLSFDTMETLYGIGMQLFEEQRAEEAKALFFLLSLLDPLAFEHWFAFGICCDYLEEHEDAAACYSMALLIEPDNPDLRLAAAEAYLQLDRLDEAAFQLDELERGGAEGFREEIARLRQAVHSKRRA